MDANLFIHIDKYVMAARGQYMQNYINECVSVIDFSRAEEKKNVIEMAYGKIHPFVAFD